MRTTPRLIRILNGMIRNATSAIHGLMETIMDMARISVNTPVTTWVKLDVYKRQSGHAEKLGL